MIRRPHARLLLLTCGTAALASFAFAQEAGVTLTFGLKETVEIDTNDRLIAGRSEAEVVSRTGLSLGLESRTRTRLLALEGNTEIRLAEDDSEVFEERRARLRFSQELTEASRATFDASYAEQDLRSFVFDDEGITAADVFLLESLGLEDLLDEIDVLDSSGTRIDSQLRFTLVLGKDRPLGARFAAGWNERQFDLDTDNPDIFDSTRWNADGALTARLAPTLRGELSLGYSEYEAEDVPDTTEETRRASLGLTYDATRALKFGASIGRTEIDRTEFGALEETSVTTGGLSAERDLRNGSIGIAYDRRANSAGAIDEVWLSRALELRTGDVSLEAGVGWPEDGDATALADLSWTLELREAEFSLSAERGLSQSSDGDTISTSTLDADYAAALTEASSWRAGLTLAQVAGDTVNDTTRLSAEVAYSREITRDWSVDAGYEVQISDGDNRDRAVSNTVFFSVGRDFVFRP